MPAKMTKTYYVKLFCLLATFLGSLMFLLPTLMQWDPHAPASRPWYQKILPSRQLKLGLDLRGGILLVLGVDVDKAVDHELQTYATDLQQLLNQEKIAFQRL